MPDEMPESPYAELTDRQLLERIALQNDTAHAAIMEVVANAAPMLAQIGPMLNDPKVKLIMKLLPKG